MNIIQKLLSNNVKKHREKARLSQFALAEQLDVNLDTISKLETCRQFPSLKTLTKLVDFFEVEPYELFIDNENKKFERDKYIARVLPEINSEVKRILKSTKTDDKPTGGTPGRPRKRR